jgi:N-acetylglucosaminyl-diphospho-decaprenol L-rhamnosyltransferase
MPRLAIVIVSHDQVRWLPRCVATLREHAAGLEIDVLVVDNGTENDVAELAGARVIRVENRGYANANNVGLAAVDAPWVLFLNPDTEVLDGSLADLVALLDSRPDVGIAGVRQVDPTGALTPTMRSFPSAARALGDALGLERFPGRPTWLGERELRLDRYESEFEGDWTIGSFLLASREALDAVGSFDERFFLYSEEVDLCRRVHDAGWKVLHVPSVTILHHGGTGRTLDPRLASQSAWAQLQYTRKHLSPASQAGVRAALVIRYGIRSLHGDDRRRRAAKAATGLLLGRRPPPFEARRPEPDPESKPLPAGLEPGVIGATGGSGTRVVAEIVRRGGMFIGSDLNCSLDALDFAVFADRWIGREQPTQAAAELRSLVRRQHTEAEGRPFGWKEPRSIYLLPFLAGELPGLRFLHLVRDGRDMALSTNQVQLRKHGDAVLGASDEPEALRSISLWREVNIRAADYGERLGERYLRIRFEDLCAQPAEVTAQVLRFFGLDGDAEQIAAEEIRAPASVGRWRHEPPESVRLLEERAADALERFGYQSSPA